jgi:hypothetical protein
VRLVSKYGIGDVVYSNRIWRGVERVKCSLCKGKMKVLIANSDVFARCPKCDHQGKVETSSEIVKFAVQRLTIGLVCVRAVKGEREVTYMADETGIRSGTNYYEDKVYETEAAAVAAAVSAGARPELRVAA